LIAAALLAATTAASGLWSAVAFFRMSHVVGGALRDTEDTTSATAAVTAALEREDDALLPALAGEAFSAEALDRERASVRAAFDRLDALLADPDGRRIARALEGEIRGYHEAGDALARGAGERGAAERYRREVNPRLRHAVGAVERVRELHFRSTLIVSGVALAALALSAFLAYRLARSVVWPLRELTLAAGALRAGDFDRRVAAGRDDELGRLAGAFNRMAEDLAAFRRSNVREVVRAKRTLEATLEALPDAVLIAGPGGAISWANSVAHEVLLAGPAAPSNVADLPLPARAAGAVRAALDGRGAAGDAPDLGAALSVVAGGRARKLLPRVMPLGDTAGGAVLVLYDVTELARLDAMRLELVAVASHELRTPLTTLRMTLLMLQEASDALPGRHRALLETAVLGAEQLASTIDEFLDLTRIEAGQLRLNCEPVDPPQLVEGACQSLRPRCEEAGISLEVEAGADAAAPFRGDPARLRVVLTNVLGNAAKYTPEGGAIRVRVVGAGAGAGAGVRIEVADTGAGVPEEFRERIFEKFFRVEHHAAGEGGAHGVGIGLYLARQIVEAHGGRIACHGAVGERGARFVIDLPAAPPDPDLPKT
jgi:NtrC-family two-component system sensor histidine kinase KinB